MGSLSSPLPEGYDAQYYIIFRFQIVQVDAHLLEVPPVVLDAHLLDEQPAVQPAGVQR